MSPYMITFIATFNLLVLCGSGCSPTASNNTPVESNVPEASKELPVDQERVIVVSDEPSGVKNVPQNNEGKLITKEEAKQIALKHFNREFGLVLEDRGQFFFASPPIKTRRDSEKAGILIDKRTGEVKPNWNEGDTKTKT